MAHALKPSRSTHATNGDGDTAPGVTPSAVSLASPRRRRPSWVLLGVVLVGVAGLLGAWVFAATSERISVMVAARDIGPGEIVEPADLRVVEIGASGDLRAVQPDQQTLLVGRAARGPIPAGTVMHAGLVSERSQVIPSGHVVVGAALEPGAIPVAGLLAGDRVDVLGVERQVGGAEQSAATATVLASGTVWSVEPAKAGSVSSTIWVAVLVPVDAQSAVAQAAADGRLRLTMVGASG